MIRLHRRPRTVLLAALAVLVVAGPVVAGPVVTAGGSGATPTSYVVTIKTIEFRRSDGSYYTFFSGSQTIDIGSSAVAAGGVGGQVGSGQSLPAGTYNGLRVTISRDFSISASATAVGPAGGGNFNCGTGGSTNSVQGGYTIQVVSAATNPTLVTPATRTLSIPPEADAAINGVSGMAIVGGSSDLQVTTSLSPFTVLATNTVPPSFSVQFDVANTVEFLSAAGPVCYAIILPPTVTYTTPTGSTTFTGPL